MTELESRKRTVARIDPNLPARIRIDHESVAAFCRRWKIAELAFFGSVLEDRFGPHRATSIFS